MGRQRIPLRWKAASFEAAFCFYEGYNTTARVELSFRAMLHVVMDDHAFCSIEALSREISCHHAACAIRAWDFSTLWRSCIGPPSQPKLAFSLPNKRLSYWRLTGYGRNDVEAGSRLSFGQFPWKFMYTKGAVKKRKSFFHSPLGGALSIGPRNFLNFFLPGGKKIEPQTILVSEGWRDLMRWWIPFPKCFLPHPR